MSQIARRLALGWTVVCLAGCSLLATTPPGEVPIEQLPVGVTVVTPQDQVRIEAVNATTIPVVLVVNGQPRQLAPGSSADLGMADLGPLPWDMTFTTAKGRPLLRDTLRAGAISRTNNGNGESSMTGFIARADLSCGQLVLVTGVASWGPAPGPGWPGDCD